MISYILRRYNENDSELNNWSIGVPTNKRKTKGVDKINYGGIEINRLIRNRYKNVSTGYKIGVMTDPNHLVADLPPNTGSKKPYYVYGRNTDNPMLLLYLMWSGSKVKEGAVRTVDLFDGIKSEKIDVLGVAVILPESKRTFWLYRTMKMKYVSDSSFKKLSIPLEEKNYKANVISDEKSGIYIFKDAEGNYHLAIKIDKDDSIKDSLK